MATTKVFTNGRSQAVRIPKEYRFDVDEVFINKVGDAIILTPVESLAREFDAGATMLSEDFLSSGIPDEIPTQREEL